MPHKRSTAVTVILSLSWLCQMAAAQSPVMVRDINLTTSPVFTTADSRPGTPVAQGGLAYFRATDDAYGQELWVTDGTSAGTRLVLDISPPETFQTNIFSITSIGTNRVVFNAVDGVHGAELWVSDGTPTGTQLLADINPGPAGSDPGQGTKGMVRLNDTTVLFAATGPSGTELYRTDGSPAGTSLLMDVEPGPDSSNPTRLTVFNGLAYFRASTTASGSELWVTDGTAAGTHMVADLNPVGDSSPDLLTVSGQRLYFIAVIDSDQELYAFDGSAVGRMKNINPTSSGVFPSSFLVDLDGVLLLSASDGVHGLELWRSDGTEAGTFMVRDTIAHAGGRRQ